MYMTIFKLKSNQPPRVAGELAAATAEVKINKIAG